MKLTGKIAGDLKTFESPTNLQKSAGILRIWIMVLGQDMARFFEIKKQSLNAIGHAASLDDFGVLQVNASSFYSKLARWLHDALEEPAFDRLLVVGPAYLMDLLSKSITHRVACRIIGEVAQDLAALCQGDLEKELKNIVWH